MREHVSITILRFVLGLVVGGYSLELVLAQLHGTTHHALIILGAAELVAAILFLIPRTWRIGGTALLVVFGIAATFHLLHGDYSIGYLAIYAAATFAVISSRANA